MWLPLLVLIVITMAPANAGAEQALADFARLDGAVGRAIAMTDRDGVVREGLLTQASDDAITMRFASGDTTFPKANVVSAERLRDRTGDGFVKGAVFGGVIAALVTGAYQGSGTADVWVRTVAVYGVIGWGIDALNTHRETIYRAAPPAPLDPALKLSFRF